MTRLPRDPVFKTPVLACRIWKALRENVTNNQTKSQITGNSQKIKLAHILVLGRPMGKTNQGIFYLLKIFFIFEKIEIF